jgi:hypothetical protein
MKVVAMVWVGAVVGGCVLPQVTGHGSLLFPPPRGGVDKSLPDFAHGSFPAGHFSLAHHNGHARAMYRGGW